jgi:KaiC/GvpD/RAD55 family RecA-like ATPase
MVNLLTGQKGSGKTQLMIESANKKAKECDGNVIFIKNSHNDTISLSFDVRAVCMADYPSIRNIDDYTGFLYGMISANSDIQVIFIDAILKEVRKEIDRKGSIQFEVPMIGKLTFHPGDVEVLRNHIDGR